MTQFKSLGLPKTSDDELENYVRDRGVPVLSTVAAVAPTKAVEPQPAAAPNRRVAVEMPEYLARELKRGAAERDCTIRYLILEALQKAGWTVHDADFSEDGRRR